MRPNRGVLRYAWHVSLEREIDRLYQGPLGAFVAERNALAKRSGADAARIKALEKPNAAAWAVNQIYWHHRPLFDRLIKAATRSRAAHGQALAGKKADVQTADFQHQAVVRDAIARARDALVGASDAATDATMTAVGETFRALPAEGALGRLTRPIQLVGFAAFGDMLQRAAAARPEAGEVVPFKQRTQTQSPRVTKADRLAAEAARRERDAARAQQKKLEGLKREAEASLARTRRQLAALEQARRALNERLQAADTRIDALRREVARLEGEVAAVTRDLRPFAIQQ